ncbi:hypothetical protein AB0M29_14950 [Streptomyces sp. NPDC051976]|uniref:hypothetical protein n=1 Tax=Streptomyces sp. NPDC051976 TaxID=3154947 RepID=UPI003420B2B8
MHLTTHSAQSGLPAAEPGGDPIRTLLWTAATVRPLDEVAALVRLLKQTDRLPNPGDEALRAAAVSRPIDDVRHLVALLNDPADTAGDADTTLRAVAVGRPIEDVADLVNLFGSEDGAPLTTRAVRESATDAAEPVPTPVTASVTSSEGAPVTASVGATAPEPRPGSEIEPETVAAPATATVGGGEATAARGEVNVADLMVADLDVAEIIANYTPGGAASAKPQATSQATAQATARPRTAARIRIRTVQQPLRSVLRWPAAAALVVIAALHLPTHLAGLRAGHYTDGVALVVTIVCVMLATVLAVLDTVRIWAAAAAVAVAVTLTHLLTAGLTGTDLLRNTLGDAFSWSAALAVAAAVLTAALAATALVQHRGAQAAARTR